MIEDLKAMIDNISQEVALLKEKQALQTGKGLLEEGMAFAQREEVLLKWLSLFHVMLTRDTQACRDDVSNTWSELGIKAKCGLCEAPAGTGIALGS